MHHVISLHHQRYLGLHGACKRQDRQCSILGCFTLAFPLRSVYTLLSKQIRNMSPLIVFIISVFIMMYMNDVHVKLVEIFICESKVRILR